MKLTKDEISQLKKRFKNFLTGGDTILSHKKVKIIEELVYRDEFLRDEIKLTLTINADTGHVEISDTDVIKKSNYRWGGVQ